MTFENTGNATIDLVHSLTGELVQKKNSKKNRQLKTWSTTLLAS